MNEPINRRSFMQLSAMGAAGLAFPSFAANGIETKMGIVVHSYAFRWNAKTPSAKYPSFATAIDLLEHTYEIGGAGVQVMVNGWTADFAKKVRERREKLGLYLEGSISLPEERSDIMTFTQAVVNAKEAGVSVLRTVASTGRRYEAYHSVAEVEEFKKKALESIMLIEPILQKAKVRLAVENHKDWTAPELADALGKISSERVGVTLDFGNSIALMEEPMEVVEALAPYVVSTHVKDMSVEEYKDGFLLSEVPLGKGFLDLDRMFALCVKHNPQVKFNLEMITRDPLQIPCLTDQYWKVFPDRKAALAKSMKMIKEKQSKVPYVSQLDNDGKHAVEEQNILECIQYSKSKLGK